MTNDVVVYHDPIKSLQHVMAVMTPLATMLRLVRDAHAGCRPDSSEQTDVVCWLQHMHT